MSAGRRARRTPWTPAPNPSGAHALADHIARRFVAQAAVRPTDLVLDLGAGLGAITRPLAKTGARIIAVERDQRIATLLTRQMSAYSQVTVVTGDVLAVPLPHRPFRVVANIPYAITTPLLRRLLLSRMQAADLVVELGAGRRLTATPPVRPELAGWHRRFAFSLGPVISARHFRPAPPVSSVVLRLTRRRTSIPR